jgi:heterodisulfide reductase subunit C
VNEEKKQQPEEAQLVPIYVMGKRYSVPDTYTIQKAMEYAGYQLVRGCGCRGGICGACGTIYRFPDKYTIQVGLACQTIVQPDMYIAQIPFFPANKAVYQMDKIQPTGEWVADLYPEIHRCMGCNTCTKSCPMDIEVMKYISAALRGDIAEAANLSFNCVMCGLCTARCPGELAQYNIAILTRRLYGKYVVKKAEHLREQISLIREGRYDEMIDRLARSDAQELKKLYKEREIEPDLSEDLWAPENKQGLLQ